MDSCNIARTTGYLSFIKTINHQMSTSIFELRVLACKKVTCICPLVVRMRR